METDCKADAGAAGCSTLQRPPTAWKQSVAALFDCTGLDLDVQRPETWQEPHTDETIGAQVAIEHRREVVAYDPVSPVVRIKAAREPNAGQMRALIAREMAKTDASPAVMAAIGGWNVHIESDCTVDRRSGWPVTVEVKTTGSAEAYEAVEIVRFERLEPKGTTPPGPKR
jgi:hypothetical protein